MAAQTIHAAGESSSSLLSSDTRAVALAASSDQLAALEAALAAAGVPHAAIREPDSPYCGALVAIGIAPASKVALHPFVRHLRLVR